MGRTGTPVDEVADRLFGLALHPQPRFTFVEFLSLTRDEVEAEAERLRRSRTGATWFGLFSLMTSHGYWSVREVGVPAATVWATHLHVVDLPGTDDDGQVTQTRSEPIR